MSTWRDDPFWRGPDDDPPPIIDMLRTDAINRYAAGDDTAIAHSVAMNPKDPAYWMLTDGHTSTPVTYRKGCYICEDPEFAVMGLPLCRKCPRCTGHIPADDDRCDNCGGCDNPYAQGPADGLDPDGFPEHMDDFDTWLGDFETTDPFRIQVGVNYDGSPTWVGDYVEPHVFIHGDHVKDMTEQGGGWEGIVISATEYTIEVRIDDPKDSTSRSRGDHILCRPEFLEFLYHVYKFGG